MRRDDQLSKQDLVEEFEDAAKTALDEADLATEQEVRDYVKKVTEERRDEEAEEEVVEPTDGHGGVIDSPGDDELGEPDDPEDGEAATERTISAEEAREELQERGVPDDLVEAVIEHLNASEVSKSMGVESVDRHLAQRQKEAREVLAAQRERAEEVHEAVGEAVAENAANAGQLDHFWDRVEGDR